MNIMQDGFSFVFTFDKPYDITYYDAKIFWYYSDSTTGEKYLELLPGTNCTTNHYSEDVLARLQKYDLGSGII